ncbi:MAG: aconitase family protein, partial [Arenicellales bacterium]
MARKTLYDKLWDDHLVHQDEGGTALIYIDRHLVHEVTSPQAFEGLHMAKRKPWRTSSVLAVPDHNVPTVADTQITDPISRLQIETLGKNCQHFGIEEFGMHDIRQGIVHVIGPEQGATLPGMTVVCGDSHTSTHGAFGALAFGIGTSEVEHVLATQCLVQRKSKNMRISVTGALQAGVTPKDVVLTIIGDIGTAGGTGYAIEFAGQVIEEMSIEGRMTLCNMAIEAGARSGMMAVDDKTTAYFKGKPFAPTEAQWADAVAHWQTLYSDVDAVFDAEITLKGEEIVPSVTWGTSPEMTVALNG